jgi:hypothetical protein
VATPQCRSSVGIAASGARASPRQSSAAKAARHAANDNCGVDVLVDVIASVVVDDVIDAVTINDASVCLSAGAGVSSVAISAAAFETSAICLCTAVAATA